MQNVIYFIMIVSILMNIALAGGIYYLLYYLIKGKFEIRKVNGKVEFRDNVTIK
jgi:hypothetical protein